MAWLNSIHRRGNATECTCKVIIYFPSLYIPTTQCISPQDNICQTVHGDSAVLHPKQFITACSLLFNAAIEKFEMTDLFENPMGLDGFEFVEYASPTPSLLESLFEKPEFIKVANHRSKNVCLYRGGNINLIVNNESNSLAAYFAEEHGPSACGLAFRVRGAHYAYNRALELVAQSIDIPTGPMELRLLAIKRYWWCTDLSN